MASRPIRSLSILADHHHLGFQNQPSKSGNSTPKTVNSLAAIAGNEGDEEPWKFASYADDDEVNIFFINSCAVYVNHLFCSIPLQLTSTILNINKLLMHKHKLTMPPYPHILLTLLCPHLLRLLLAYVVTSLLHMVRLSVLLAKYLQLQVLSVLGPYRVQVLLLTLKIQAHLKQLDMPKKMKNMHATKKILLCTMKTTILNSNNSSLTPLSVDHLRGHRTMNGGH